VRTLWRKQAVIYMVTEHKFLLFVRKWPVVRIPGFYPGCVKTPIFFLSAKKFIK